MCVQLHDTRVFQLCSTLLRRVATRPVWCGLTGRPIPCRQVNYNLVGWLEKNKDPLNDTVVDQFKKGKNELVVDLFADHAGQSAPKEEGGGGGKGESGVS